MSFQVKPKINKKIKDKIQLSNTNYNLIGQEPDLRKFPKFINSYLIALKTVARSILYVKFVKLYPTYIFIYFLFLIVCIIARVYISPLI